MVDRIRRAIDQLEAPICPTCRIDMTWTRSTLIAVNAISHQFHCPNCHRTGESRSEIENADIPPSKLSAPAPRKAA